MTLDLFAAFGAWRAQRAGSDAPRPPDWVVLSIVVGPPLLLVVAVTVIIIKQ